MTINITHRGVELTPAIRLYAEEKMLALQKYFEGILHIDVEIGKTTRHHRKGDVFFCVGRVQVPGNVIRIEKDEEDLYKAIDKVKDHLRETLSDLKKQMEDRGNGM